MGERDDRVTIEGCRATFSSPRSTMIEIPGLAGGRWLPTAEIEMGGDVISLPLWLAEREKLPGYGSGGTGVRTPLKRQAPPPRPEPRVDLDLFAGRLSRLDVDGDDLLIDRKPAGVLDDPGADAIERVLATALDAIAEILELREWAAEVKRRSARKGTRR